MIGYIYIMSQTPSSVFSSKLMLNPRLVIKPCVMSSAITYTYITVMSNYKQQWKLKVVAPGSFTSCIYIINLTLSVGSDPPSMLVSYRAQIW